MIFADESASFPSSLGARIIPVKLDSLKKLYVEELRDLYSAETQITKAMPKVIKAATHPKLKAALEAHLVETQGQIARLKTLFEAHGESPEGKTCNGMKGVLKEGSEMIGEDAEPEVRDAGLIGAVQRVEHYEMAGYGSVLAYAKLLKDEAGMRLLKETLDEEKAADKKLSKLAESTINLEAL